MKALILAVFLPVAALAEQQTLPTDKACLQAVSLAQELQIKGAQSESYSQIKQTLHAVCVEDLEVQAELRKVKAELEKARATPTPTPEPK